MDPEEHASNGSKNTHDAIVPHEQRVDRKTHKGLTNGGADGRHEQEHGHDEGFHIFGGFCECVFETGDGSKDFAEGDEDVSMDARQGGTRSMGVVLSVGNDWTHDPVWIHTLRGETWGAEHSPAWYPQGLVYKRHKEQV